MKQLNNQVILTRKSKVLFSLTLLYAQCTVGSNAWTPSANLNNVQVGKV